MKKFALLLCCCGLIGLQDISVWAQDDIPSETTSEKEPGFEEKETSTKQVVGEETIPFASQRRKNPNLAPGEEIIVQEGIPGIRKVLYTYETSLAGDKLIRTDFLEVIQEPVDQIIEFGPEAAGSNESEATSESSAESSNNEASATTTEATQISQKPSTEETSQSIKQGSRDNHQASQAFISTSKATKKKANKKALSSNKKSSRLPDAGESHPLTTLALGLMFIATILFLFPRRETVKEKN
ncbi:G5 domain-containing protein [Ignavigranum ruoffiae]|uniref:LPXTG cell wall anchor domain-containing protein n=1 Tax=Ignavigranum ruoffiae TaxID=89093 RepID=UPI003AFFE852